MWLYEKKTTSLGWPKKSISHKISWIGKESGGEEQLS